MSIEIRVPRLYSVWERIKDMEAPWKKKGQTAGTFIHDLCAQQSVITLCPLCTNKFNPGRLGYRKEKEIPRWQATCLGCNTFDPNCTTYIYEETYSKVRSTADERRGLAKKRELAIKRGHFD